jgi:uncharacterized protein YeaO (DUF488 family)
MKLNVEYARIYNNDVKIGNSYCAYIDKMYPRGITKGNRKIKNWIKGLSPSYDLIEWYHANPDRRWPEFKKKYLKELNAMWKTNDDFRDKIKSMIRKGKKKGKLLLFYSSKDESHNNARVLANFIIKIAKKNLK